MRPSEEMPLDPEVLAELEAIDATLAGEPVDPIHAELAELALLLATPVRAARKVSAQSSTRVLGGASVTHLPPPRRMRGVYAVGRAVRRSGWRSPARSP